MDLFNLIKMGEEELLAQKLLIIHEAENCDQWADLATSRHGEFLLKYREERQRLIRGIYKTMDLTQDGVEIRLAKLQGYEEDIEGEVALLLDAEKRKKKLDSAMESVNLAMKRKRESAAERPNSIISNNARGNKL